MKSLYPLRENIWEYLNSDKLGDLDIAERKNKKRLKTQIKVKRFKSGNAKLLIFLFLALGLMVGIDTTSVGEECCHRMRHLALALRRAEQALRLSRLQTGTLTLPVLFILVSTQTIPSNKVYIEGARAFRGSNTVEWGAQAALWGVVPLYRATPPPDIILSLRRPIPSDCWSIRGSYGEVIIELPRNLRVDILSLEHIRPDTAHSAPKNFTVYGILVNGTWIKVADGMYQNNKAAKQYYHLDPRNSPLQQVVFRVLSNQGNPKDSLHPEMDFVPRAKESSFGVGQRRRSDT
ncbi:jg8586 [Pararge aegeria aegeria]|uniref:Jg8586 protein n=1 Tax=Pararge aegeria aegeria TaxID=348720 RepID=A0A8S4RJS7_9NEOP|nr:jg8586 [Pararge aegeria aegeria]